MKQILLMAFLGLALLTTGACSVVGKSNVEIAPYRVLIADEPYDVRHYDQMVLVSTPMSDQQGRGGSFGRLFDYISGENNERREIPMTAPVFMDQMDETKTQDAQVMMSFVMPADFKAPETPAPQDPLVKVEEITDYTVATITFSGRLTTENIKEHEAMLRGWIAENNYKITGAPKTAGYNAPFTIPALRRNEVLIPIEKP